MIAMLLFLMVPAHAQDVVVTLPWLGAITSELAPDAEVTVLAAGTEDPHYLSPTPALMAQVGQADLYVENGLNLELWSARLLDGAGNPSIRRGQSGHVWASEGVPRLEVPTTLTRAEGDLHPEGNPHLWLDPLNWPQVADNIAAGLGRIDPGKAEAYAARAEEFRDATWERLFGADLVAFMGGDLLARLAQGGQLLPFLEQKGLEDRLGGWLAAGRSLRGQPVVFYHQSWVYFVERFGMEVVGYVEDRPGISPSAAHKQELSAAMTAAGATVIGISSYYDDRLAQALAAETGARVAPLAGDLGALDGVDSLQALIDQLLEALGG